MMAVYGHSLETKQQHLRRRWFRINAVVVGLFLALLLPLYSFAAVTTDQEDYSPGSVVTISGNNDGVAEGEGFLDGELVVVDVNGPNGYTAQCSDTFQDGAFECPVTLWDSLLAVGAYSYTATGQTSGNSQSGTFTDNASVDIDDKNPNPAPPWYRTVAGTLDLTITGDYLCTTGGSTTQKCSTPVSVLVEIFPDGSGSALVSKYAALDAGNWEVEFTFPTDAAIPTDGVFDVKATYTWNVCSSNPCLPTGATSTDDEISDKHFGIDNTPPALPNITVDATDLTALDVSGTDAGDTGSGLKREKVDLYLIDTSDDSEVGDFQSGNVTLSGPNAGNWIGTYDASALVAGDYCVFGFLEDKAGNGTWFPDDPEVEPNDYDGAHCFTVNGGGDQDAPTVAITYPEDGETYLPSEYLALCEPDAIDPTDDTGEICGTADDGGGSGVDSVEVWISWDDNGTLKYWDGASFEIDLTPPDWLATATSDGYDTWARAFNPGVDAIWQGFVSETYNVQARATDEEDNVGYSDSDGIAEGDQSHAFTIAKGVTSVLYTGLAYDDDNNGELELSAAVTSLEASCVDGRTVRFDVDGVEVGNGFATDSNGDASTTKTNVGPGIYQVTVTVDETLDCTPASFESVVSVVSPGDAANGGGWYHNNYGDGSPRISFGFTVRQDCGSTANPCPLNAAEIPYKGQFLAINNGQWRLKGTLDYFGNTACPEIADWTGVCGSVRGTGNLYSWDQTLNGGLGDWVLEDDVTFTVGFYDGGSSRRGGARPDYAGILTITGYSGGDALPTSLPLQLKGGNVTLSGESTPTSTVGGGKKK